MNTQIQFPFFVTIAAYPALLLFRIIYPFAVSLSVEFYRPLFHRSDFQFRHEQNLSIRSTDRSSSV
ncbi:hypothetical protein BT69DRAFT_1061781 [Atractiella rhizophila]|nr:hypothetical protein BT69DRAFT_1061781 [Atractiella rhizophila]